jgi:LDH2 family malate/lactate/ureidoglycolate dehydrogenase
LPGARAAQERQLREASGIPLNQVTHAELAALVVELGLGDKYRQIL